MSFILVAFIMIIFSNNISHSQCKTYTFEYIQKSYLSERYNTKKRNYNLTLINLIEQQDLLYTKKGKICYLGNYSEMNSLDSLYHSYNQEWKFLMDIKHELLKLIEDITLSKSKAKYAMSPIIIPKTLNYSFNEIISFAPIFQVDYEIFYELKAYDIRNATGNYYFVINYGKSYHSNALTIRYLSTMAISSIIISSSMVMLWKVRYDRHRSLIGKNIAIFPILKIIISILLYFKINLIESGNNNIYSYSKKTHIHYIFLSFSLIFKTVFWFFSIFISVGWEFTFTSIDNKQLKNFFRKYVLIYCSLSIDEAIDHMFRLNTKYVSPSDIKNIMLYFLLILNIVIKMRFTYRKIRMKIVNGRYQSNNDIESLEKKCIIIKKFIIVMIVYFFVYLLMTIAMNVFFEPYNTPEVKEMHYHWFELGLIISYILIFIPNESLFLERQNKGCSMKMFSNIYISNLKEHEHELGVIGNKRPIIVLNPNHHITNKDKAIDSISIGFIS